MLARQAIELDKPVPCRDGDARLWFAEDPEDLELAKAHCRGCPLRAACLAGAIERREPCGVWGGEIFDRGQILPAKRRRGRPDADRPVRPARAAASARAGAPAGPAGAPARPATGKPWPPGRTHPPGKTWPPGRPHPPGKIWPPGEIWPPGTTCLPAKTGRPFARCAAERGACRPTATPCRAFRCRVRPMTAAPGTAAIPRSPPRSVPPSTVPFAGSNLHDCDYAQAPSTVVCNSPRRVRYLGLCPPPWKYQLIRLP